MKIINRIKRAFTDGIGWLLDAIDPTMPMYLGRKRKPKEIELDEYERMLS